MGNRISTLRREQIKFRVAQGKFDAQIARELGITRQTVKNHRESLLAEGAFKDLVEDASGAFAKTLYLLEKNAQTLGDIADESGERDDIVEYHKALLGNARVFARIWEKTRAKELVELPPQTGEAVDAVVIDENNPIPYDE